MLHADEAADNEEKPKTADVVDVGPGSVDCLALHKKGLYVAGQVSCYPVHLRAILNSLLGWNLIGDCLQWTPFLFLDISNNYYKVFPKEMDYRVCEVCFVPSKSHHYTKRILQWNKIFAVLWL